MFRILPFEARAEGLRDIRGEATDLQKSAVTGLQGLWWEMRDPEWIGGDGSGVRASSRVWGPLTDGAGVFVLGPPARA